MIRSNIRPRRSEVLVLGQTWAMFCLDLHNNQLTLSLGSEGEKSESSDTQNLYENPLENIPWEQPLMGRVLDPYKVDTRWLTKFQNIVRDWKCSINVKHNSMTGAPRSFTTTPHNILDSDSDILNPFLHERVIHCSVMLSYALWKSQLPWLLDICQINAVNLRCLGPLVIGPIVVELRKRVFKWQFHQHLIIVTTTGASAQGRHQLSVSEVVSSNYSSCSRSGQNVNDDPPDQESGPQWASPWVT